MLKRALTLLFAIVLVVGCSKKENPKDTVLATVNGKTVTLEEFNKEFDNLPQRYKETFQNDKVAFLDELITRELLLQEATRQGIEQRDEIKGLIANDPGRKNEILIQTLTKFEVQEKVKVSDKEMKGFYEQQKDEMQGKSFAEVKDALEAYLLQMKQKDRLDEWIGELRAKAKITKNDKWIASEASKIKNPLDEAFKSGKVTVVDFGASGCRPCEMMKPIFAELKKKYKDKANILLLQISEYRALARKYKVMLIPTQIFFDIQGNEVIDTLDLCQREI